MGGATRVCPGPIGPEEAQLRSATQGEKAGREPPRATSDRAGPAFEEEA